MIFLIFNNYGIVISRNLRYFKWNFLLILIPTNYVIGGFILEYNIIKDSLYMPANIDRDNQHIFLFSVSQFSPKLFKLMCLKFNRLVKELKEFEIQRRQDRLQSDF